MGEPSQDSTSKAKPSATARKKAARLMAVQALYQIGVNREPAALVVHEYLGLRKNMEVDGEIMVEPDESLFRSIVLGTSERQQDLEGIVEANRPLKGESLRKKEPLLDAVFLCGSYELLSHHEIEAPVIISSYVDVAKAFFTPSEASLVNAVLDSIRKVVRA